MQKKPKQLLIFAKIINCVLFIDAYKAFDRVRHIDLFKVLSKRNMCALVRRLLMTMYSDQRIQVRWSNALSEMFHMKNGVKQGAVLSPKLFTVVLDGLFDNLLQSGVVCHMDNIFAGAFGYADDIELLAPSADALKIMITFVKHTHMSLVFYLILVNLTLCV